MLAIAVSGSDHELTCLKSGREQGIRPRYVQSLASWLNLRMKLPLNASRRHQVKNQKVPKHLGSLVIFLSMTSFALLLIEMNGIRQGTPFMI